MNNRTPSRQQVTFAQLCMKEAGIHHPGRGGLSAEPLVLMKYDDEVRVRFNALDSFCRFHHLAEPEPIIKAPLPRGYRSTSKRKAVFSGGRIRLMADIGDESGISLLEPAAHSKIFSRVEDSLNTFPSKVKASLHYCIIRGENDCSLIFNVDTVNSLIIKTFENCALSIKEDISSLVSAFLFHDPSRSKYYFESSYSEEGSRLKRLFGARMLHSRACGVLYQYHPLSFSQVNMPVAELMANKAKEIFSGNGRGRLLDLYCGYGFFSCCMGKDFSEVIGIDNAKESVFAAMDNASHIKGFPDSRFTIKRIDARTLDKIIPSHKKEEYILLDPPRKGTVPGVIPYLAQRQPMKVLHIFCGVDEMPKEIESWKRGGYSVSRIIPFDMFPGTLSLEVMVYLEKKGHYVSREYENTESRIKKPFRKGRR
jgi:tRNA/tmRNA/rRNA uracil-C5-methylase (TrmA/RlmC/RlmD family)